MKRYDTYQPTDEDWADYCDYLDETGYDYEDDDVEDGDDPLEGRGYQPLTFDLPEDEDEDDILAEFGF